MKVIYDTCDKKVLDIYLNNLSKPLSYADKKAYQLTKDKRFQKFYFQNAGIVEISDELSQTLNKYYQEKSKVFSKLAQESYASYQKEQNKLDQISTEKAVKNSKENTKRNYENYWSEFEHNLEKANKDLGTKYQYEKGVGVVTPPITEKYQFRVSQLGACNIDRFMKDILETRKTATYSESGKTTKFSFTNVKIDLPLDTFDLIRVYFTSRTLFSFINAKKDSSYYAYSINETMNYNLIVYLEKGNQKYFYGLKDIKNRISIKKEDLVLVEDFDKTIEPFIAKMDIQDISIDIEYEKFKLKDDFRKAKRVKMEKLRSDLEPVIFPCNIFGDENFDLSEFTN